MIRPAPNRLRAAFPLILALGAIVACTAPPAAPAPSSAAPSPISSPTGANHTPAPARDPAIGTPTSPAALKPGGLGSTRAELEARWGPARQAGSGDLIFADGRHVAGRFSSDRATRFTVDFGEREPTSLLSAAQLAEELMPAEAVPGGILDLREGWVGRLHHSVALAAIIPDPAAYPGGQPGDFAVLYQMSTESPDRIIRLVLETGVSP